MRYSLLVGEGCERLHDQTFHGVQVNRLELGRAPHYVARADIE